MSTKKRIRVGSKVTLKGKTGLSGYGFYPRMKYHLKKNGYVTVRYIKPSGGCLFREFEIGENMFGEEQGLMPRHLVLIKSTKKKIIKNKKSWPSKKVKQVKKKKPLKSSKIRKTRNRLK